jgi:tetrachloro-p-hydroquinone reductive dehalogenase
LSGAEAKVEGAEVVRLPSAVEHASLGPGPAGAKPTLYHFPISLTSQQVRLALAEKHVDWISQIVNIGPAHENLEPWYANLNPALEVPTLEFRGTIVAKTVDIVRFIDEHFHGPALMPNDAAERAEVMRWIEIQDEFPMRELGYARTKGMVRWFQHWSMRQMRRRLRRLIRKNPMLRGVYEAKLAEIEHLERSVRHRAGMTELVDDVELLLDEIEETLQDDRQWLTGPRYTLADLMWTAVLSKLEQIGFARSLGAHRRPKLAEWYARLRERPSWDAMVRHISATQALRFYGPAVAKTFVVAWVLKWAIVLGIGWLVANFG